MTLKDLVPSFGRKRVSNRHDDDSMYSLVNRDINSLINEFFNDFQLRPFGRFVGSFSPKIEVTENDKEINVSAEIPGLEEKDIEVSISRNQLTISGEKKEDREKREKDYLVKERSYGSFTRTIPLYIEIDTAKTRADFKKGVLKVTIPKAAVEIDRKKISVKAE